MKLGSLFKSLAPTIASAAGSPLAGMALSIVAKNLNLPKNTTANEIEDLIEREPEKATLLKQADLEFQTRIKEMEIDLESLRIETVDRKDARYHFSQDWTPKVFSILCLRDRRCLFLWQSQQRKRQMSMTEAEIKIIVEEAAELGARKALRNIGLNDANASSDVSELRSLLDSWRVAKRTVGKTIVQGITTLILGGLIAGSYFNFFNRS